MIPKLFKRTEKPTNSTPAVPDGLGVYVVGDIHGRVDLLRVIHEKILEDAKSVSGDVRKIVVYLGDYIDRGLESKNVIDMLIESPLQDFESVFLKGNHEDALLSFLDDASIGQSWFSIGGGATVYSYSIRVENRLHAKERFNKIQNQLRNCLPTEHLDFLSSLKLFHEIGDYVFVHAGIMHGIPLEKQNPEYMMWARDDFHDDFLESKSHHNKVVVHGHMVTKEPDICKNRIGIDTGAYVSNLLTCLVLEKEERRFLRT